MVVIGPQSFFFMVVKGPQSFFFRVVRGPQSFFLGAVICLPFPLSSPGGMTNITLGRSVAMKTDGSSYRDREDRLRPLGRMIVDLLRP